MLALAFLLHVWTLGVFALPFIADDYIFAYEASFDRSVPDWAPDLLPYWRPISRDVVLPLVLQAGADGALIARIAALLLILGSAALQYATWLRLGSGRRAAVLLVILFLFGSWQVVLVGWCSGLQDALAVFGVALALRFAASGRWGPGMLALLVALLSKESAIVAIPVLAGLFLASSESSRRKQRVASIGALCILLWGVLAWTLGPASTDATTWPGTATETSPLAGVSAALLTAFNLADLPGGASKLAVQPWLAIGGVVLLAIIAVGGKRSDSTANRQGSSSAGGASESQRGRAGLPSFVTAGWTVSALAVLLGAAWLPYPWSSYLIAPAWPALVLPIALLRPRMRQIAIGLLFVPYLIGSAAIARPASSFTAEVETLGSSMSPSRLLALGRIGDSVHSAVASHDIPDAEEFFVDELPRLSWVGLGSGLAGPLWADDEAARAYSPEERPGPLDLPDRDGYYVSSGYKFDAPTYVLPYREIVRILDRLRREAADAAFDSATLFEELDLDVVWSRLAPRSKDRFVGMSAGSLRDAGMDSRATELLRAGCERFGETTCCNHEALALLNRGDANEALILTERLATSGRANGNTYLFLALARAATGNLDGAGVAIEKASTLGISPELVPMGEEVRRRLLR